MRLLSIALPVAALATMAAAGSDFIAVLETGIVRTGVFVQEAGASNMLDTNEGCRNPGIPHMNNICFDWGNGRGHFNFDGQGKRCFRKHQSTVNTGKCGYGGNFNCYVSEWYETNCTW
jgi:hypothetical protein